MTDHLSANRPLSFNSTPLRTVNVALRLERFAESQPNVIAIAEPLGRGGAVRQYRTITFAELNRRCDILARGLLSLGITPGEKVALVVRPGIDFVALVFALIKAGIVVVLVDPGVGKRNVITSLASCRPVAMIGIPLAQAIRVLFRKQFPDMRTLVTLGRRWFWGGATLQDVERRGAKATTPIAVTRENDPAAILFTSGATGPPKGVVYTHLTFDTQAEKIAEQYSIAPGEIDLPGFPLFGLFNAAMGVTTILPDMDFTRPANVDPRKILDAANQWKITQAFGSPAMWNAISTHCEQTGETMPTLRRVLSAGAPVPGRVLARMKKAIAPNGEIHTPYGATEALPVATISASDVLGETQARTNLGAGVCVGKRFAGIEWRVIAISDNAIPTMTEAQPLAAGEIGELVVRGPQVTTRYATSIEWNALAKIADGDSIWHRMGDVGYLDEHDRFWFCGRKAHRIETAEGRLFTIPCEAIFNTHSGVQRSALVGVGPRGSQTPHVVVERTPRRSDVKERRVPNDVVVKELCELAKSHPLTASLALPSRFHIIRSMPVDIRHNSKIHRELLAKMIERGELK